MPLAVNVGSPVVWGLSDGDDGLETLATPLFYFFQFGTRLCPKEFPQQVEAGIRRLQCGNFSQDIGQESSQIRAEILASGKQESSQVQERVLVVGKQESNQMKIRVGNK